jgi:hypothetical protein
MADRNEIDCPRAKTWMTPCIARDGQLALTDYQPGGVCVGCGDRPGELLSDLAQRYEPATHHPPTDSPPEDADALTRLVAAYVERISAPDR